VLCHDALQIDLSSESASSIHRRNSTRNDIGSHISLDIFLPVRLGVGVEGNISTKYIHFWKSNPVSLMKLK
jgi:hypothetical protein